MLRDTSYLLFFLPLGVFPFLMKFILEYVYFYTRDFIIKCRFITCYSGHNNIGVGMKDFTSRMSSFSITLPAANNIRKSIFIGADNLILFLYSILYPNGTLELQRLGRDVHGLVFSMILRIPQSTDNVNPS